jgi:hypothetical protein
MSIGFRDAEAPTVGSHMAVRLSALRTGRPLSPEHSGYLFLLEAESTPGP